MKPNDFVRAELNRFKALYDKYKTRFLEALESGDLNDAEEWLFAMNRAADNVEKFAKFLNEDHSVDYRL
jgi:hypothetical protein